MPHANGRIYWEIVNGVEVGANTDDVNAVLGTGSHDVQTLCMDAKNINMWAKYKPQRIDTPQSITLTQRKEKNFGLAPIEVYSGFSDFLYNVSIDNFKADWEYDALTADDWARLDDFVSPDLSNVGYRSDATPPFGTFHPYVGVLSSNNNDHTVIPLVSPRLTGAPESGLIDIGDFGNLDYKFGNWYFGILLYSSTHQVVATMTTPIAPQNGSSQVWQVDMGKIPDSYAGDYIGIPFLSSAPHSAGSQSFPSNAMIVGIGISGVEVKLISSSKMIYSSIAAYYESSTSTKIHYKVSIKNNYDTKKDIGNVVLQFAQNGSGGNPQHITTFYSVSLLAGETKTFEGTYNANNRLLKYGAVIISDVVDKWIPFMENFNPVLPDEA